MAHGNPPLTQEQMAEAEIILPMWRMVFDQFLEHRMAVAGLIVIGFYILVALGAPLIALMTGLDPERQNPLQRYQPLMTRTVATSDEKESAITKFVKDFPELAQSLQNEIVAKNLVSVMRPEDALFDLANKDAGEIDQITKQMSGNGVKRLKSVLKGFETLHVLGTDELGRDVLIRLAYGTRVSMGVGILVALVSALVGMIIGSAAGYHGGWVDTLLMRVTDALLSLPTLPILIVIAAIDLDKLPWIRMIITTQNENILKLVFILCLFSWMQVARLVRGSVLSLREREFILATKTLGARDTTIIFRHLFPNVIAPLLVSVTLGVGNSILFEAALSFLGLGIQQPTPSWGNMLFNAQDLISEAPILAILPGLNILAVVMSFNYLGDGLQDAIDPKAIRR